MDFFSVQNILVHIPIGAGGYDLSWIEAVGTIAGLLCIGLASLEKISNYFFGLINVTLFGIIFFQIQLYASLLLHDAPRDKRTYFREINYIAAAFQYQKKNYNSA